MSRKAAEAFLYKQLDALEGGTSNSNLYRSLFQKMSDTEFGAFVERVREREIYISIIAPNVGKFNLSAERSMAVGKALGVKFFQRLLLTDGQTGEPFLTPHEYLIIHMPVRRLNQHLIKKKSIPESAKIIDHMSGQVTSDSKGSAVTLPEFLVMESKDLTDNLIELMKGRGGDETAYQHMLRAIEETGGFSVKSLLELNSKPTSTETLRALLLAVHFDNTIGMQ